MHANQILSAIALLTATAHAHVSLTTPTPYGKPDTSPLSPDGSDFPCKSKMGFTASTSTNMVSGQSQSISFAGSAVHNGGSCQLSLTKDKAPTANSTFKVIYSIMGGCPGINGGPTTYQFKVPSEVPNGDYSFSWSWANNIGNREFYHNCAPVSVSGSKTKGYTAFNALPDMAVFNIKSVNQCGTVETFDVKYPNPGKYVLIGPSAKLAAPTGAGCGTSGAASSPSGSSSSGSSGSGSSGFGSSGSGSSGSGSRSSGSSGSASAGFGSSGFGSSGSGYGSSGSAGSRSGNSGLYTARSGSRPSSAPSIVTSAAYATATAALAAAPTNAGNNSAAAPAAPATPAGATTCSTNGAVVCSTDGSAYGLCNWGRVIYQPVAAGTKCLNGSIRKRWTWKA